LSRMRLSGSESPLLDYIVTALSKPFYGLIYKYRALEPLVIGGGLSSSLDEYARKSSTAIFVAVVVSSILAFLGLRSYLPLPLAIAASIGIGLGTVLPASLSAALTIPAVMYRNRGAVLEAKFPSLALVMSLLLASGLGLSRAIEMLYEKHLGMVKHFSIEIGLLRSYIRVGVPLDEALTRVARITPSDSLRELFLSLASAIKTGGDLGETVSAAMREYLDRYGVRVEKTVNDIGIVMESYLAICMLLPLLMGVLSVLFMMMPIGMLNFQTIMFVTVFVLVPLFSLGALVIVDSMVSKLRV